MSQSPVDPSGNPYRSPANDAGGGGDADVRFSAESSPAGLGRAARYGVLTAAFLGWLFAGTQMAVTPLASRSATVDLLWPGQSTDLSVEQKQVVGEWFAWHNAAFLFGAAAGGLLFGWCGDRFGRVKAMSLSILCYSTLTGAIAFVRSPEQLLVLRFLASLGVGGMWPNGVALVSEAWSDVSRPTLAGLIGTAANVGIVMIGFVGVYRNITPESWRWLMLLAATPALLGLVVWAFVPESPRWLAGRGAAAKAAAPLSEVFRPPMLQLTLLGICLGTIPLLGGWGSGNWLIPWADNVGGFADPKLKAWTQITRSFGGTLGSLAGGWVAGAMGRRFSYFAISLGSLLISAYIFRGLTPLDATFGWWAFALGVVSGLYFGWLPLCLPELFPTRVRSTGAGVAFNFGRVGAAVGVLGAGELMRQYAGDYGKVGSVTSLIYVVGLVLIWFAPRRDNRGLED